MAILEILKYPNPNLKKKSQPVEKIDPSLRQLVQDMAETMYAAPGVGLAAPQVGHLLRVVVLDVNPATQPKKLIVLINPEIITSEGECVWDEGCLSLPDFTEEVKRKKKVVVRGRNLEGEPIEIEGEDLLAVALQHEIEHLEGILLVDHLSPLKRSLYKRQLQKEKKKGQTL
jgi:peptide deformylase